MKKTRIISLAIALLMLALCFVSCAGGKGKTVNCTISVIAGDNKLVDAVECPLKTNGENAPVVLDALKLALDFCEADYELSATGLTKVAIGGEVYANGQKEDGFWFWNYTVNGVEPENGSAAINTVNDGDKIVYTFTLLETEEETAPEADAETEEAEG